jgi:hypothetical protein
MLRRLVFALLTGVLSAVLWAAPQALAQEHDGDGDGHHHRRWVPEFDTAAVGTIAAVVAGGGVLVARRRKR